MALVMWKAPVRGLRARRVRGLLRREEVVRGDCGKREAGRFEPSAGKGLVARATLYCLLRYPASLRDAPKAGDDEIDSLLRERLETLLSWHADAGPEEYERHRTLRLWRRRETETRSSTTPEWAGRVDFERAV